MYRQSNNFAPDAALYVRLSRDDENEGDSNSIANQITLLTKYCEDHGITQYKVYKDDGYSGTNFNRPGFQKMMEDIEAGHISMVIVKDMSRFGRNYLEVGMYTEIRFPELGIRFIAVNDGVDSERGDNDFTPFRNIMNEWYAKDTSRKIRAVMKSKGNSGERLTHSAIYGYKKAENDCKKWIRDVEAAQIVYDIGMYVKDGLGPEQIARKLTEQKVPPPAEYFASKGRLCGGKRSAYPDRWYGATVAKILDHWPEYLGHTVNFRTYRRSFKSKKKLYNPPEKWMIFENTHEPIWTEDIVEAVRRTRNERRRPTKMGEMGMFSGLAFCADCGEKLYHCRSTTMSYIQENYTCSTYRKRNGCSAHYIRAVVLEELVLQNLQRVLAYAQEDEDEFAQLVMKKEMTRQTTVQTAARKTLIRYEARIVELDGIIKHLYEDNITGKLTDERFAKLADGYEKEQADLEREAAALREQLKATEAQTADVERFLKVVRKYTMPTELTPVLLRELVEKVVVHAPDKSSGHRVQRIDIHYKFIGEIVLSPEYSKKQ